jgi:hypothetical protein
MKPRTNISPRRRTSCPFSLDFSRRSASITLASAIDHGRPSPLRGGVTPPTRPQSPGAWELACLAFLAVLTLPATAAPSTPPITPSAHIGSLVIETKHAATQAVVEVKPLHDAGGLTAKSADGDAINVSYTEAIRHYLTTGGYTVVDKAPKGSTPAYTVEGDLSHLSTDTTGNGPYLCVLRLFSENRGHTLVGQWAGVAQSLRYLTANLNETEGVDSEGLLGEIGGKIAETIRGTSDTTGASTFAAIVDVASQPDLIDAFPIVDTLDVAPASLPANSPKPSAAPQPAPVPAKIGQPEPPTPNQVTAGAKYRLQIRSTEPGDIVLVGLGPTGEPVKISIPDDSHAITVTADKPLVLPVDGPLTAPSTTGDLKIIVLERRDAPATNVTPDTELPVRVLRGTTPPSSPVVADPDVARLLRRILADPPHTWIAHTVTLHIASHA